MTLVQDTAHLGFALEYSLGHTTHAENLKRVLAGSSEDGLKRIVPHYLDLPFDKTPVGPWGQLPLVRSNWSVRASMAAYRGLRPLASRLNAILFHTQVTSLFSVGLMRQVPSVISLDATPLQIDRLGEAYGHTPGGGRVEAVKKRMQERAFHAARRLVTWSAWAKDSLVQEYGVAADRVEVIPPGIDTQHWKFASRYKSDNETINLLFVGGDFTRKGGDCLLDAYRQLPPAVRSRTHLHLVTRTQDIGTPGPGVTVYRGMTPNSPELMDLYRQADLFVFPTRGDCLPLAVLEALSAGLPIITTSVGALSEAVVHNRTGWIVPPDDADALREAISLLVTEGTLRTRLGDAARQDACDRFDATQNYRRLLRTVQSVAR